MSRWSPCNRAAWAAVSLLMPPVASRHTDLRGHAGLPGRRRRSPGAQPPAGARLQRRAFACRIEGQAGKVVGGTHLSARGR